MSFRRVAQRRPHFESFLARSTATDNPMPCKLPGRFSSNEGEKLDPSPGLCKTSDHRGHTRGTHSVASDAESIVFAAPSVPDSACGSSTTGVIGSSMEEERTGVMVPAWGRTLFVSELTSDEGKRLRSGVRGTVVGADRTTIIVRIPVGWDSIARSTVRTNGPFPSWRLHHVSRCAYNSIENRSRHLPTTCGQITTPTPPTDS